VSTDPYQFTGYTLSNTNYTNEKMSDSIQADIKARIAIVGGGIGGLVAALSLLKHGNLDVQIYEAATAFSEIGAGLNIGPNAQRALRKIGPEVFDAFARIATGPTWPSHRTVQMVNKIVSAQRSVSHKR
jgi:2-polyprenyl-6-methoxyphenol hydroxylase-like FAD-dependent oxidoreductase